MADIELDAIGIIARALTQYVVAHPAAADTVSGIHRWWLPDEPDTPLPLVEPALFRLLDEGIVRRVRLADGTALYVSAARPAAPPPVRGDG